MLNIDLIIFDLDGTLVNTKKDIAIAINHTLESFGFRKKNMREISRCVGEGFEKTLQCAFGDQVYPEGAVAVLKEYYIAHPVVYSKLYSGVKTILKYFSEKRKAVLTNKDLSISVDILGRLGIYNCFDMVVGGDTGCKKPSPHGANTILKELNIRKETVIIVGDMAIDILTGRNSGIKTCGVTYGIGRKEDVIESKPDIIIDRLTELKGIINK